jgi:hypothetical protein
VVRLPFRAAELSLMEHKPQICFFQRAASNL